ncbi:2,3-bisphosphoglycerate-independent phosphoglycerate mutase [Candidatus Dependentiae bacterium]|nr:MAG: 2,3-bisphosphoglycerate-independent phosphoglycerate mutase [Candidatus Dependentiae bacterium]
MVMYKGPVVLIIMDGLGYRKESEYNAVYHANTPVFDHLFATYPHAILAASGCAVGLPDGYIGNSEVGHITLGAGRSIKQIVTQIQDSIADGSFFHNKVLLDNFKKLKKDATLHIMGLLSDSGVHSHQQQFYATMRAAYECGITNIVVHPFLDGRDVLPRSARAYLQQLDDFMKQLGVGIIGSIQGRWYAMDRDGNWDRTKQAYNVLTTKQKHQFTNWNEALSYYYDKDITDEFIPPTQFTDKAVIADGDGIAMLNFRADRARQLTQCFVDPHFDKFPITHIRLAFFITPVAYGSNLNTASLFPTKLIHHTLKELLVDAGKSIFSIAETEKYAHVTYFFGGGREKAFPGEKQIMIKSISVKTYENHPCMSAPEITKTVLDSLAHEPKDFYLINYANPDMVGHSGNFEATVKAVECVDKQLKELYKVVIDQMNGTLFITADHGNAELMYDKEKQQPHTAHTTSDVPFVMIQKGWEGKRLAYPMKTIADVVPVILTEMRISVPKEMKE